MQAYFFPYFGYFQLIHSVDHFCLYEHVSFRKRSWLTRNRIVDKGSRSIVNIHIPVQKQSSFKLIKEVSISESKDWAKSLLNLLFFNYKKAQHFEEIYSFVETALGQDFDKLHDLNSYVIQQICMLLDISTVITTAHDSTIETELMEKQDLHASDTKSERIYRLCNLFGADQYVNPTGGMDLYNYEDFQKQNITLNFIQPAKLEYHHYGTDSTAQLSIVDALMHMGTDGLQAELDNYKLIGKDVHL